MTKRIFETLKSRLPDGARAESRQAIDALAEAVAAFKTRAASIAKDGRYTVEGKAGKLGDLRKATLTGPLGALKDDYARKTGVIKAELAAMRRQALGGVDADPVAALRGEMQDAEVRSLLREMTVAERLAAVNSDANIARAALTAAPMLSAMPADLHATLLADLTDQAIAAKFGDRATQFSADAEEIEAVASAIQLAADMVARGN
jgi:hypothetical protein